MFTDLIVSGESRDGKSKSEDIEKSHSIIPSERASETSPESKNTTAKSFQFKKTIAACKRLIE
jgi:hypothetical protein